MANSSCRPFFNLEKCSCKRDMKNNNRQQCSALLKRLSNFCRLSTALFIYATSGFEFEFETQCILSNSNNVLYMARINFEAILKQDGIMCLVDKLLYISTILFS